ncbi:MAG: Cof-type HAD-IIB family hydrolase [Synergistaceae bacterium]|nr:Cof-type HAD-IIB family hydrolase [Synergistaceae bacterium]
MNLLVTDIDSTLSVGETVSNEVVSACRELCDNGWQIMVATGRTLRSCTSHIRQISALDAAIVYDGARVMNAIDGSEIMGFELSHGDALEIMELSWDAGLEIQITGDESLFCRALDVETRDFCHKTGLTYSIIDSPNISGKIYRVAFWGEQNTIRSLELTLKNHFRERFNITRGGDYFLDVLSRGVSKGHALEQLINRGCIEAPEMIVAAGDHMNDYELLSYSDISAVPHNCAPELLKLADIIMPSVENHGFRFLSKILINK